LEVAIGDRDSSRTRVKPIFDKLYARDSKGLSWISDMLRLPESGCAGGGNFGNGVSPLEDHGWGAGEKKLSPPRVLLQWLVACAERPRNGNLGIGANTIEKRVALLLRDKTAIGEALALLSRPMLPRTDWYILEGQSRPDVFLQTPEFIVVIEGKRTERGPTCKTKWMRGRDQMIRHIDCAWEIRGTRKVLGFFLVEGDGNADAIAIPPGWTQAARNIVCSESLKLSLPHRTQEERAEIKNCFLGVATWQKLCANMRIEWGDLPDRLGKE
jgi:hypothetical protein